VSILTRSLIAKSGYDRGFKYLMAETSSGLTLSAHSCIILRRSPQDSDVYGGPTDAAGRVGNKKARQNAGFRTVLDVVRN